MIKLILILILSFSLYAEEPNIFSLNYKLTEVATNYDISSTNLYVEGIPTTNISQTWGIGADHILTISFTTGTNSEYCVESTPMIDDWRTPWQPVSMWQPAIGTNTFSHGVLEQQQFYRIKLR